LSKLGRKNRIGFDSEVYGRKTLELVRQGEWIFMSQKGSQPGGEGNN